ncbi:MAG: hypothetical protein U9N59_01740 [Campylobacterota bacterium]|nr:hypothetical protein [Campylobacterota bacterium]
MSNKQLREPYSLANYNDYIKAYNYFKEANLDFYNIHLYIDLLESKGKTVYKIDLTKWLEMKTTDLDINTFISKNKLFNNMTFKDIYDILKSIYPSYIIIIENGYFFEVLEDDAESLSDVYGWEIYERQKGIKTTGFPDNAEQIWKDLEYEKQPYIIVSQLKNNSKPIDRKISRIYKGRNDNK